MKYWSNVYSHPDSDDCLNEGELVHQVHKDETYESICAWCKRKMKLVSSKVIEDNK